MDDPRRRWGGLKMNEQCGKVKALSTLAILLFVLAFGASPFGILRQGMKGTGVIEVQENLKIIGYFTSEPTGYFGNETAAAVAAFQRDNGINSTGVVDAQTFQLISDKKQEHLAPTYTVGDGETIAQVAAKYNLSLEALAGFNQLQTDAVLTPGQTLRIPQLSPFNVSRDRSGIELVHWDEVNLLFPVGATARVTDLETGMSFRVHRHGGTLHADSEPLTPEDTAIMLAIYGGRWSWSRRAIVVDIGTRRIAASMNGMPHGLEDIRANNFNGHFCIHFYGSRLHKNRRIDPEHQRKVMEAFTWFRSNNSRG